MNKEVPGAWGGKPKSLSSTQHTLCCFIRTADCCDRGKTRRLQSDGGQKRRGLRKRKVIVYKSYHEVKSAEAACWIWQHGGCETLRRACSVTQRRRMPAGVP